MSENMMIGRVQFNQCVIRTIHTVSNIAPASNCFRYAARISSAPNPMCQIAGSIDEAEGLETLLNSSHDFLRPHRILLSFILARFAIEVQCVELDRFRRIDGIQMHVVKWDSAKAVAAHSIIIAIMMQGPAALPVP